MRPASSITSINGLKCSNKLAYNRLSLLLSSGVDSIQQQTKDLAESEHIITDATVLAQLSSDALHKHGAKQSLQHDAAPSSKWQSAATEGPMLLAHVFATERKQVLIMNSKKRPIEEQHAPQARAQTLLVMKGPVKCSACRPARYTWLSRCDARLRPRSGRHS